MPEPTPTLQNKMLALTLLKVRCPCGVPDGIGIGYDPGCPLCHGEGRIYLLDPPTAEHPDGKFGLRVSHLTPGGWHRLPWEEAQSTYVPEGCPCQGRGWIPTQALEPWIDAALALPGVEHVVFDKQEGNDKPFCRLESVDSRLFAVGGGKDKLTALLGALVQAVVV